MVSNFSIIDNGSNKVNNDSILGYEGASIHSTIGSDEYKIVKETNKIESKNILNMKIHEIVEEASDVFSNFQQEYSDQVEKIFLENKKNNIDNKIILINVRMYCMALIYYLREKNNLIYIGLLLIIISFLLYLFKT